MVEHQREREDLGEGATETETARDGKQISTRPVSLVTWTLATFDTTLFVLLGVLAAHTSGELAGLLAGLNTLVGVAAFCYLWALFVLAVRWVNSRVALGDTPFRTLVLHGVAAGCATGVVFLLGLFAVALVPTIQRGGVRLQTVLVVLLIGGAVAAVVGGVVGLVASLLDTAVYRLAGYLLPEAGTKRVTEPRRQ
ncbi:hypothetical protein SAMN05443574_103133 [Haloarcula vallismortis]|uniref:DUF7965 domain-containing protein n=2 Tax=Haloarcula vallismortis TaxID=28442 RepID=M0JQM4_HALVA|nr:hypothetical protein [Haloarcula vallismortis]EMA11432.1 hypothetical protein C437_00930 [Haloarcula vallismortis ATCC 29715]SDW41150.1 hypothetical protein SAMN05443574_103133 [Haloarcula vallismortis]